MYAGIALKKALFHAASGMVCASVYRKLRFLSLCAVLISAVLLFYLMKVLIKVFEPGIFFLVVPFFTALAEMLEKTAPNHVEINP